MKITRIGVLKKILAFIGTEGKFKKEVSAEFGVKREDLDRLLVELREVGHVEEIHDFRSSGESFWRIVR